MSICNQITLIRLDRAYFTETENWKHCSKIIFKYMNSLWDLFLMKKLLKSEICGSMNSAQVHCSPWKSQQMGLLFMNSSRITPWNAWKPKRKKNAELQNANAIISIQTGT